MDSFDLLGVPARFDLDPAAVRSAFLRKIAEAHPDRASLDGATAGTDEDDNDAEALAARLNAAKLELENPESRATALLRRLGGAEKTDDRSLPAGFLMEMMETRERIDAELNEAVSRGPETARQALARWEVWAAEQRAAHAAEVGMLFAEVTNADPTSNATNTNVHAVLKAIRTRLNAWRYVERLVEQLRERALGGEAGLGGGGA